MPHPTHDVDTLNALNQPLLKELGARTIDVVVQTLALARRREPELTAPKLLERLLQLGALNLLAEIMDERRPTQPERPLDGFFVRN